MALEKRLPLPPIYRAYTQKLRLQGAVLGYFSLWPGAARGQGLIEALDAANGVDRDKYVGVTNAWLLIVGSHEGNPICVDRSPEREDLVYVIYMSSSPVASVTNIASDFESFLLLAANLHKISVTPHLSLPEAVHEMSRCCTHFGCNEGQFAHWRAEIECVAS